jgi:hypothetical protein
MQEQEANKQYIWVTSECRLLNNIPAVCYTPPSSEKLQDIAEFKWHTNLDPDAM